MSKTCSVPGCHAPHIAHGYCQNHYRVFKRHGTPTPAKPTDMERLLSRVVIDESTGCWLFTGAKNSHGYGTLEFRGRQDIAHRMSWALHRGDIPAGMWVLHRCDVPPCCNPDHLFLGDAKANNADMAAKGRHDRQQRTHCPQGHPYSGENLFLNKRGDRVFRVCRICKRESQRRSKSA